MAKIPLIRGDKVDNNVDYRDALPVNYYAVQRQILGDEGYFLNYYGLTEVVQGIGVSRGAIYVARPQFEGHYRVSGNSLVLVNGDSTITNLGTISGDEQCSLTYSLNNLAIVTDGKLWYYNPTDGLRQITSDNVVGSPIDIVWADFRFILTDGEYLYQSSELDEEVYDPLAFTGSDFQPDEIIGVALNEDNELIAFNAFSTEYNFNAAGDNFTYTRIQQKAVKAGIIGTHCKCELGDQWFTLSRRINTQPQFSIIQSGTSTSITSREIEKVLAEYKDEQLSKAVIEVFIKDATTWMIAHLPDKTLAFNYTLSKAYGVDYAWSVLKSDVVGDKTYRAKDVIYDPNYSEWLIGDKLNANIGFLDDSVCTQYNDVVEGLLYSPAMDLESLSIDKLTIETIPGIAPNNDATVFISRSDDLRVDGTEWTQLYGGDLDYNQNFEVRRLGYVRDKISFRVRTASRSRMAFSSFDIEAS